MAYRVIFSPEANDAIAELYRFIANAASSDVAIRYVAGLIDYCETLKDFPRRAIRRDDVRPGLHVTNYRGRTVVAFAIDGDQVMIIGVFHGGQDFESAMSDASDKK